jgi:hypothetical protein
MINIIIKFTNIGLNSTPFNLFTNVNLVTPLYTDVTRQQLLDGFNMLIPTGSTYVYAETDEVSICNDSATIYLPTTPLTPTPTPTITVTPSITPTITVTPTVTPFDCSLSGATFNYVEWYFGTLEVIGGVVNIPTDNDININSGTTVNCDPDNTIVANFNSGVDDFLWFATPTGVGLKTEWAECLVSAVTFGCLVCNEENTLNNGLIGGPADRFGNLFSEPYIVTHNGQEMYLYISTVRTNVVNVVIKK